MTPQRQFAAAIGALVLLTGVGVGFYMAVEGWSAREALYMVAISLSTVGFGEVQQLSAAGQWFTIAFVALGFAVAGFAVAGVTAFLVEGDIRSLLKGRRLDRQILSLRDHYVLCGCGAVGREIAVAFARAGQAFVVVDISLDSAEMPPGVKVLSVEGDATQEEVLEAAGVRHARGLIAALHDDPDNVYVTLTARQLNPDLRIIAQDSSGRPRTQPGFSVNLSTTALRAGDRLIALGTDAQLRDLCALAGSR